MLPGTDPPRVSAVAEEIFVSEGSEAVMECRVSGQHKGPFTWTRPDQGGTEVTPLDPRIQVITVYLDNTT